MSRFIIANRLSIQNVQSEGPTFIKQMSDGSTRKSHIYLTLTNEKAERMIFNWRIVKRKLKTEHQLILFEMDAPSEDHLSLTPSLRRPFATTLRKRTSRRCSTRSTLQNRFRPTRPNRMTWGKTSERHSHRLLGQHTAGPQNGCKRTALVQLETRADERSDRVSAETETKSSQ